MFNLQPYIQLMRLDKPIGIWLFFWPTLWALWFAAGGLPPLKILLIFALGLIMMRSAGCVFNDFCDQKFDKDVERTKERPLALGLLTSQKALVLFLSLSCIAAYLAFQLNALALKIAVITFLLAMFYPLTKRWCYIPQFFLGMTVACAVPMAFASIKNSLPNSLWLIYAAALVWPIIYDTIYALVDRHDDIKIGVKSTALLFGEQYTKIIGLLQGALILLLLAIGLMFSMHWPYYLSLLIIIQLFFRQHRLIKEGATDRCFKAFSESHWIGFFVFLGIAASYF